MHNRDLQRMLLQAKQHEKNVRAQGRLLLQSINATNVAARAAQYPCPLHD